MIGGSSSSSSRLRYLSRAQDELSNVSNKLASGKRITRASDDAAGLAIASSLAVTVSLSGVGKRNIADAQSSLQIADGALGQISEIGTRLSELATQSANGTLSDDQRVALNNEFQALSQEAQRIASTTNFNGTSLLGGGSVTIQAGTESNSNSQLSVEGTNATGLSTSLSSYNVSTASNASAALGGIATFISDLSSARGSLGAVSSRLDSARQNLDSLAENSAAARSRIEDLDVAEGVAQRTASQIRLDMNAALNAQTGGLSRDTVLKLLS